MTAIPCYYATKYNNNINEVMSISIPRGGTSQAGVSSHAGFWELFAALLAYASVLASGHGVLADQDTYLHIAVGRWIIAHAAIPHVDLFSNSVPGRAWIPHEWLSEVAVAWIYDHFGWAGLLLTTGLAFASAIGLLVRWLRRSVEPPYALIGAALAWALCFPHVLARPHVFAWPLLVAWSAMLIAAREKGRPPPLPLALLMVFWANMHGSFMFGIALVALLGGEAAYDATSLRMAGAALWRWGLFGALSLAAAMIGPNGPAALQLPFLVTGLHFALSYINEWSSPDFQQAQPIEAWLLLVLLGILYQGIRLPVTRIAMLLVLVHMTLAHQRHAEILGLVAPLLAAPALAAQLPRGAFADAQLCRRLAERLVPATVMRMALIASGLLALALSLANLHITRNDDWATPAGALAFIAAHPVAGNVYNDYEYGGYLLFSGIAPFVDGRAEMYGDEFVMRAGRVQDLPAVLQQYRIAWTLLPVKDARVTLLDHIAGWRRVYADDMAVIHLRDEPGEK
jgi:hypothetical protein